VTTGFPIVAVSHNYRRSNEHKKTERDHPLGMITNGPPFLRPMPHRVLKMMMLAMCSVLLEILNLPILVSPMV
jgi:hypothetical protein